MPTLREDPGDAEAVSHRLLVRGGFIRHLSAGLWTYLPLGCRVHEKGGQIVRGEQTTIGGQEWFMPVVIPARPEKGTGGSARRGRACAGSGPLHCGSVLGAPR